MNRLTVTGFICADPETSTTAKGVAVARFQLAVRRDYKNQQTNEYESDFFNCTAWRELATTIGKYCKKGMKVLAVGNINFRTYEDNNGVKRQTHDFMIQQLEFMQQRANGETSANTNANSNSGNTNTPYNKEGKKKYTLTDFDDGEEPPF